MLLLTSISREKNLWSQSKSVCFTFLQRPTADGFNRQNRQSMIPLVFLVSYTSFRPDLPVVLVRGADTITIGEQTTLDDIAADLKKETRILFIKTGFPLRRSTGFTLPAEITDTLYVFPNSSVVWRAANKTYEECTEIEEKSGIKDETVCAVASNVTDGTELAEWFTRTTGRLVVISEAEPKLKYGLPNPFTPNVWNCFFYFLLMIVLISWAMSHYATIDVQTRFAKKNN